MYRAIFSSGCSIRPLIFALLFGQYRYRIVIFQVLQPVTCVLTSDYVSTRADLPEA